MIFGTDEEAVVKIQKGSTTNKEGYNFVQPAPKISILTDGDIDNSEDIQFHSLHLRR